MYIYIYPCAFKCSYMLCKHTFYYTKYTIIEDLIRYNKSDNIPTRLINHKHTCVPTCTHVYINIDICVCICVCVYTYKMLISLVIYYIVS